MEGIISQREDEYTYMISLGIVRMINRSHICLISIPIDRKLDRH